MKAAERNAKLAQLFTEYNLDFEKKKSLFRIYIDDYYIHYYPRSGKWGISGNMGNLRTSESPIDFINEINKYASDRRQYEEEIGVNRLRDEVMDRFYDLFEILRERNYKTMWIWYRLNDDFDLSLKEICWIGCVLGYQKKWVFHKVVDKFGGEAPIYMHNIWNNKFIDWASDFYDTWGFNGVKDFEENYSYQNSYLQCRLNAPVRNSKS